MNNKAIQILRGSRDYDPSDINNELLDGQPFYSKKNQQLYVGDKSKHVYDEQGNLTSQYVTTPAGASWIKPGEGNGSFVSACLEDESGSPYGDNHLPKATGHESIAFGKSNQTAGDRSVTFGESNTSTAINTLTSGLNNKNNGADSFVTGQSNENIGSASIISGNKNKDLNTENTNNIISGNENKINKGSNSLVSGLNNTYSNGSNSIILGSENDIGLQAGDITSDNNIISGYKNNVIGSDNIVLGSSSATLADDEYNNVVDGSDNIVLGDNNELSNSAEYNVIIGKNNTSSKKYSLLLGNNLKSTKDNNKTAIGYYNADLTNSLFEIGNGTGEDVTAQDGKVIEKNQSNAFSVNKWGDAFLKRCLIIGQESRTSPKDLSSSKFAIVDSGNTLLNITSGSITASLGDGYYRLDMWDPATTHDLIDFTLDHVYSSSDSGFVIARSGLDLDTNRYMILGSGNALTSVSVGKNVTTTSLGYSSRTIITPEIFKTFGIEIDIGDDAKSLNLGNTVAYPDDIQKFTLDSKTWIDLKLSGTSKLKVESDTINASAPITSTGAITAKGALSVVLPSDSATGIGCIKFQKYNALKKQYDDKCTINYNDTNSLLTVSCDTNIEGSLTADSLAADTSISCQSLAVINSDDTSILTVSSAGTVINGGLNIASSNTGGDALTIPSGNISAGNGTMTAVTFKATSDRRLKENIKSYTCNKSILDLPIYEFDYINSGNHTIGCIAQDLREICPEIVSEDKDGFLHIEESKLVYLLLLEVKKLKEKLTN